MYILIPAYEPDLRLVALVNDLRLRLPSARILVVDDGSGLDYAQIFERCETFGADVLTLHRNRGKGAALKVGFAHIQHADPAAHVVTADSDGQHRPRDIARVAAELEVAPEPTLVLGERGFTGKVPLRSRVGNALSRLVFRFSTGLRVHDTQTGLRGYSAELLDWAREVEGERFEYEMSVLMDAAAQRIRVHSVAIETVYLNANESSHFRPVVDSLRVFKRFLAFGAVSFGSFLIDFAMLLLLNAVTANLLLSVIGARMISGTANFTLNKLFVFRERTSRRALRQFAAYIGLAIALVAASYGSLWMLTSLGLGLGVAKVLSETVLYLASYVVQQQVIFRRARVSSATNQSEEWPGNAPHRRDGADSASSELGSSTLPVSMQRIAA